MKKALHSYFIPHKGNNFKPRFFEYRSLLVLLLIASSFFIASVIVNSRIHTASDTPGYVSSVVNVINHTREDAGKPTLTINQQLMAAAQMKADDMAEKHYFAHTSPSGITPWFWFEQAHYPFIFAGETITTVASLRKIDSAWGANLKDGDHILDARFKEVGVATASGYLEGKPVIFIVALFGAPANPTNNTTLSVITETSNTLVVKNDSAEASDISIATEKSVINTSASLVTTQKYFYYGLVALAFLLAMALFLFIFIEINKQYPFLVLISALLLVVILVLAYVSKSYYLISFIS